MRSVHPHLLLGPWLLVMTGCTPSPPAPALARQAGVDAGSAAPSRTEAPASAHPSPPQDAGAAAASVAAPPKVTLPALRREALVNVPGLVSLVSDGERLFVASSSGVFSVEADASPPAPKKKLSGARVTLLATTSAGVFGVTPVVGANRETATPTQLERHGRNGIVRIAPGPEKRIYTTRDGTYVYRVTSSATSDLAWIESTYTDIMGLECALRTWRGGGDAPASLSSPCSSDPFVVTRQGVVTMGASALAIRPHGGAGDSGSKESALTSGGWSFKVLVTDGEDVYAAGCPVNAGPALPTLVAQKTKCNEPPAIWRVPRSGGEPVKVAAGDVACADCLAVDEAACYWIEGTSLARAAKGGGDKEIVADGLHAASQLVATRSGVFLVENDPQDGIRIVRMKKQQP